MTTHTVGTREEWLAARKELLEAEKEHLRHGDELARRRQELPWVPVEKETSLRPLTGGGRAPAFSRSVRFIRGRCRGW